MSVRLRVEAFHRELAIRGISQADLARDTGLSEATVSAAARGLAVAPGTLRRIGEGLSKRPVLELSKLVDGSVEPAFKPVTSGTADLQEKAVSRAEPPADRQEEQADDTGPPPGRM